MPAENDYGKGSQGMRLEGLHNIAPKQVGHSVPEATAWAGFKSQPAKHAQVEQPLCLRISTSQGDQPCRPDEGFQRHTP